MTLTPGTHHIIFTSAYYSTFTDTITVSAGQELVYDKTVPPRFVDLGLVVKTESNTKKPIENVTVSLEVLKPELVQKIKHHHRGPGITAGSGVTIVDAEPQIRAGSGYSFGAGSRVMVLMDDMPLLSGDAGRPFLGLSSHRNLEQPEAIKGASLCAVWLCSAQWRDQLSALAFPKDKPLTKIIVFAGCTIFPNPATGRRTIHRCRAVSASCTPARSNSLTW